MNIILSISFAVRIRPGISIITFAHYTSCFYRSCWSQRYSAVIVTTVEPVIQYLHTVNHIRCRWYRREWGILYRDRMNVILTIAFTVCICPGIGIISFAYNNFLFLQVQSESALLRSYRNNRGAGNTMFA
jgi:hypothetical protein